MMLEGRIRKSRIGSESQWLAEIRDLALVTEGKSRQDAAAMLKNAIESLVDSPLFVVVITLANNGKCLIKANDDAMLVALILRRLRAREGLTVREVSLRLKSKSPNAYAQYETGKVAPSMDTLTKLLRALNPQFEPVLKIVA